MTVKVPANLVMKYRQLNFVSGTPMDLATARAASYFCKTIRQ